LQSKATEHLLEVEKLSLSFQNRNNTLLALDGVSFGIKAGEIVGIVGESGSGKSVTALSIMQLLPAAARLHPASALRFRSGRFGIRDLRRLSAPEMRSVRGNEIAMIFQEPMTSLNPVMRCGQQIAEVLTLHRGYSEREASEQVLGLLEEVQLRDPIRIGKRYPHELSGGQKQRIMIAMAMACRPSLLIADEPTTALDVTVQAGILKLIEQLREDLGTAVLFITHDLGVIAEIADRVLVMHRGRLVEEGPVYDLFNRPEHPYTKGLLACRPRLDMKLRRLPTMAGFFAPGSDGSGGTTYRSVGQALLLNAELRQETIEKRLRVIQGGPLIRVRDLHVEFVSRKSPGVGTGTVVKAVDGVSFDIFPGETVGLVGESGCGKTTLGRCLLGLVKPAAGEIRFGDKVVSQMSASELRQYRTRIQILFQDPYSSLNPRMAVGAAIMEPMKAHNILSNRNARRKKALYLLDLVGMEHGSFDRYPHEFSGGQRQRIGIARALALEPECIVCDESVSALDVSIQAQVLNLLNDLKDELGFTALFISHDLSVVKFMADRILVMRQGRLIEMGFADALFERPKEEYTRRLINAIPRGDLEDIRRAEMRRRLIKAKKELF
jgi:peptide/nickel transport system ATP-binding protein